MSLMELNLSNEEYLSEKYLKHMVLDFVQMHHFMREPLVFDHGEDIWVWDVKGEKYLDGISGVWVTSLGHSNKRVIEAVKAQLDNLIFASPILSTNTRAIELVEMLGQIMPEGLTTIKILSGGSEATETAMKLVRQYFDQTGRPHKKTIISRYLNFHGVTLGALTATGMANRKAPFEPLCGGFRHIAPPYCIRCPYNLTYPECDVLCARFLEQAIIYEGPDNVAAFMAEPIQLSTGNIVPPEEYWPIIRQICDKYDVMIILDEVATGMGRTGRWWGSDTFNFVPDVLCMGKGMAAGYMPLSGVAFRDEVAQVFISEDNERAFADGHTYGGNPIACAAGIAVLQELHDRNLVECCNQMGQYMMKRLEDLKEFGVVGDIRGAGLMIGIEFVQNSETMEPFPGELNFGVRVGRNCILNQHMLIRYAPNWVALAPPFIVTEIEIDEMVSRLGQAIIAVLAQVRG
ncbi:MAG TPA: aspartate aminotransferase family protein [candidate division Zixibacteria bacterium]|nr:aspartate aminotransferase family protein [candidate division Zixibacteria bacterium]